MLIYNQDFYVRKCSGICYSWWVGSSDFPWTLCFMWFWFGLEILRLVNKKAFFKIFNSFYLIWPFHFQKYSIVQYKSWNKFSSKLGAKGIKRSGILRWFQKMCRILASRSFQRFLAEKNQFFYNFFPPLLNSRLLHICEISAKFRFFWYPLWTVLKIFFSTLIRGGATFFGR